MGTKYVRGSDTSEAAAVSVDESTPYLRGRVLDYISARGVEGATCDEVEGALDMRHQTASPRVNELAGRGAIVDSGRRRKTRSGRNAVVYVRPAGCSVCSGDGWHADAGGEGREVCGACGGTGCDEREP